MIKYIPKKINQIQGLIDSMPENQYAMDQLDINNRFDAIKTDLEVVSKWLCPRGHSLFYLLYFLLLYSRGLSPVCFEKILEK